MDHAKQLVTMRIANKCRIEKRKAKKDSTVRLSCGFVNGHTSSHHGRDAAFLTLLPWDRDAFRLPERARSCNPMERDLAEQRCSRSPGLV